MPASVLAGTRQLLERLRNNHVVTSAHAPLSSNDQRCARQPERPVPGGRAPAAADQTATLDDFSHALDIHFRHRHDRPTNSTPAYALGACSTDAATTSTFPCPAPCGPMPSSKVPAERGTEIAVENLSADSSNSFVQEQATSSAEGPWTESSAGVLSVATMFGPDLSHHLLAENARLRGLVDLYRLAHGPLPGLPNQPENGRGDAALAEGIGTVAVRVVAVDFAQRISSLVANLDTQIIALAPKLPSVVALIQSTAHHSTNSHDPVPPLKDLAIPLISELLAGLNHAAAALALTASRDAQLESDLAAATACATALAADLAATQSALQISEHDRDTARDQLVLANDAARQVESQVQGLESRVAAERKARHAQAHAAKVRVAAVVAKSRAAEIARWHGVAETIEGLSSGTTCHADNGAPAPVKSPTSLRDAETRVQTALAQLAARIQDERRAHEVDVRAMSQRVAELERDLRDTVERERETRSALGEQAKEFHEHQVEREAHVGVLVAESSANIKTLTSVARELHGKLAHASKDQALLRAQFLKAREELRAAQKNLADAQDEIAELRRANQVHLRALASLRSARAASLSSTSAVAPTTPPAPAAKSGSEDSTSLDPPKTDPVAHLRAELKRKATLIHHLQTQLTTATDTTAALAADAERSVIHFRRQLHDAKSRVRSLEGVVREVVRWCVSHERPTPPPVVNVAARKDAPSPALAARADRIARTFLNVSYDELQRQTVCKALGELGRVDGVLRRLDEILVRGSRSGSMARETVALLQRSAGAAVSMTAEGISGGLEAEGRDDRL